MLTETLILTLVLVGLVHIIKKLVRGVRNLFRPIQPEPYRNSTPIDRNDRGRSAYPDKSTDSHMTFDDLYWALDVYNDEEDDGDEWDDEGECYYEEIVEDVEKRTGRKPKRSDRVPEWVLQKYRDIL